MEPKYFVVFVGRKIGIYNTQREAEYQIEDYPDGFYETYTNFNDTQAAIERFFIGAPAPSVDHNTGQSTSSNTAAK